MLLLGGAFALAGCTFGENIEWLPWSAPDPLPVEIPAGVIERVARTSALAAHLVSNATAWKLTGRRVRVNVPGGQLEIDWREDGVWMTGPTAHVFDGVWRG